jgi:acetyl esterase/lipase
MKHTLNVMTLVTLVCLQWSDTFGQAETIKGILYAQVNQRKLFLDLYTPTTKNPYLIVWVHGGAWHSGSKDSPPLGLLGAGYALASVDYRLSSEAPFPAMIHDIKASIRFLRANAKRYGFRSDKIIIWGSSAGGHLAALVGTTNGDKALEGNVGMNTEQSSSVAAVIDFYGPTNFTTILKQSTPHGLNVRGPALGLLLGKPVEQVPDLARQASPVYQVDPTDPPLFVMHGDQDYQVPVNQSLELDWVYRKNKLNVRLEIIHDAGHTDNVYYEASNLDLVKNFLAEVLK